MLRKSNSTRKGADVFGIGLTMTCLFLSIVLVGCDSDPLTEDGITTTNAEFGKRGYDSQSRSPIYSFADMSEVGSSVLKRYPTGIAASFSAEELVPGDTYTLWFVVFDEPHNCTPLPGDPTNAPACTEDDVFGPMGGAPDLAKVSVLWAGDGAVAPEWGRKYLRGTLSQNDASESIFGDGLDNPTTAEVHLVMRSHGEAIPGLVRDQITTFNGGCNPGEPNEGQCYDMQFSIHKAN